jgi:hypothetical protein
MGTYGAKISLAGATIVALTASGYCCALTGRELLNLEKQRLLKTIERGMAARSHDEGSGGAGCHGSPRAAETPEPAKQRVIAGMRRGLPFENRTPEKRNRACALLFSGAGRKATSSVLLAILQGAPAARVLRNGFWAILTKTGRSANGDAT